MIHDLSAEELKEIFRKIYTGENPQGDFLTHFAAAVVYADAETFSLLAPLALQIVLKFRLLEDDSQVM